MSSFYDLLSGGTEKKIIDRVISKLEIDPPKIIIEIGCGTGNGLISLQTKFPQAQICGVDLSIGMCLRAGSKIRRKESRLDIQVLQGDALALPMPSASADLVFLSFTLELFPSVLQSKVLAEIKRVLRPSGTCTLITMFDDGQRSLLSRLYLAAHNRYPHIVDCRPINTPAILQQYGFEMIQRKVINIWGLPAIALSVRVRE